MPDEKEREAITQATRRVQERPQRVTTRFENRGKAHIGISRPHADREGWENLIMDAFGTSSADFTALEMDRLVSALSPTGDAAKAQTAANAALAAIGAVQPANEIEAMLASQMVVNHGLVMDLLGRTKRAEYQAQFEMAGNMAVKLMRTFTAQIEAHARLRRGGEQTVRVEHVHVHPGGQAVVGTVTTGGGGKENVGQPHALDALGYAPGAPMWSPDAERDAVPAAGNGKATLPDARRRAG